MTRTIFLEGRTVLVPLWCLWWGRHRPFSRMCVGRCHWAHRCFPASLIGSLLIGTSIRATTTLPYFTSLTLTHSLTYSSHLTPCSTNSTTSFTTEAACPCHTRLTSSPPPPKSSNPALRPPPERPCLSTFSPMAVIRAIDSSL